MIKISQIQKIILEIFLNNISLSSSDVHNELLKKGNEISLVTVKRELSELKKSDPTGNARLTDLQLQKEWATIDKEVESFNADYKEMIATFKFI